MASTAFSASRAPGTMGASVCKPSMMRAVIRSSQPIGKRMAKSGLDQRDRGIQIEAEKTLIGFVGRHGASPDG